MNMEKHVELLKEKLANHMHIHKCTMFMHDGVPVHHSKKVKNCQMTAEVTILEWDGNSAHLSSMKNLREILKRKDADDQTSSASALVDETKNDWIEEISVEYCQKHICSMLHHIHAVIQNKGRYTKY